jgi:hypothetical protein
MLDYYLFKQVFDLFTEGKVDRAREVLRELQEKYIEVNDENTVLRSQVQEFEDILYLAKNMEFDGFSYWLKTGTIKQGPFCRNCFDREGLLIRLTEFGDHWRCTSCDAEYEREQARPEAGKAKPAGKAEAGKVIHLYK